MKTSSYLCKGYSVGYSVPDAAVSKSVKLSQNHIKQFPISPQSSTWISLNLQRKHYDGLVQTTPHIPLVTLREDLKIKKSSSPKNLLGKWKSKKFATVLSLAKFYETAVSPALHLIQKINERKLETHGLRDMLRLRRLPAIELDKKQDRLDVVQLEIIKLHEQLKAYVQESFSTEIYNSLLNIFRLCGEKDAFANRFAMQLLDDMSTFGVSFDNSTKLLMKKICFDDEPHEDSNMLFAFVEVPEMGEVSLKTDEETMHAMNKTATKIASSRHNIPLSEGRYMTSEDSHPNLIQ
ncbi:spherulin 4-like cell surface protein [Perkinsela sp. CCAP 1560/4]|nr:spherulin 4-like cell surface protein [Perkinsela sp. CCAP 1560/4]|eukprot:KNH05595.1 spherulin 4-like cell surface protein [Perkinsela sp. CCAP 1560/4]